MKEKEIRDYVESNSEYNKVFISFSNVNSSEDYGNADTHEVIGSNRQGLIVDMACGRVEIISFNRLFRDQKCRKYGVPYDYDKEFYLLVINEEESGNYDYYVMYNVIEKLRVQSLTRTITNFAL